MYADYGPREEGSDATARTADFELVLSRAERGDLDCLAALRENRYGTSSPRHARWVRQALRRSDGADGLFLVARVPPTAVGYGLVSRFNPPPDSDSLVAPAGYYLRGVVVHTSHRRRGIGRRLTEERLRWVASRSDEAYCCVSRANRSSIDLHLQLGFRLIDRPFRFPRLDFGAIGGVLMHIDGLARRFSQDSEFVRPSRGVRD